MKELILLVDDDAQLRRFCRMVLEMNGFAVLDACCPSDALQRFEEHPEIDLLITDYDMPECTGLTLATILAQKAPQLKMLMISGKLQNDIGLPAWLHFLPKPFAPRDLRNAVNQCLAQKRAAVEIPTAAPAWPQAFESRPAAVASLPQRADHFSSLLSGRAH